ncbi:hypothetical protein ACFZDK_34365 [Streptomyces sp. NPDC007901]|uniref:hypothetical protein n=1 Tax=Streptomyces sp. NPDC007901 TaxID=3364785 RepID=UPI0036E9FE99
MRVEAHVHGRPHWSRQVGDRITQRHHTIGPDDAAAVAAAGGWSESWLAVAFSDETIGTRTSGRTLRELADRPEPTEAAIVVSGGVDASRTEVAAGWFSRTNPDRPPATGHRPERATAAVRRYRHPAAVQHRIGMDASSPHS